jgi:hypothetical protein
MRGWWLFAVGAVCGAAIAFLPRVVAHLHGVAFRAGHGDQATGNARRTHTEEKFVFTARAPLAEVAPLFGADRERVWSSGWNPQFIHPLPASDEQGMVFTVAHDHLKSVWVNTEFDPKNGDVEYVYVIPDALVTVIRLKLTPRNNQTQVEVEYDRTALSNEADAHVLHMAEQDRAAGPEWEKHVNDYLEKRER